jgi:pseudouridine-5'-phosphate glycosidase/pseudouridine kinase
MPAVAAADRSNLTRSPIAFASPNLAELAQMYAAAQEDALGLTAHPSWWTIIDKFSLGSDFQIDLEKLSRKNISDHGFSQETLGFLVENGVAQMAINLLPFFQNLLIKCGDCGVIVVMRITGQNIARSSWVNERSNPCSGYVVAHGKEELLVLQHFPPLHLEADTILSVTGAGDSLVGSVLASLMDNPDIFRDPSSLGHAVNAAQHAAVLGLQTHFPVSPELSKMKVEYNG